jgi:hypothetical protein
MLASWASRSIASAVMVTLAGSVKTEFGAGLAGPRAPVSSASKLMSVLFPPLWWISTASTLPPLTSSEGDTFVA